MGDSPETDPVTFDDPIFDDPILEPDPDPEVSDDGPFPASEHDVEPSPSSEDEPPVQAAAPIPPVGPPPSSTAPPVSQPVSDGGFTPSSDAYYPPQPAQPAVQFYSRQQLQQGVEQGIINEDQMVAQLQLQEREQIKQEAVQAIRDEQRQQSLQQQVNQYHTLAPGWNQPGSAAFQKANAEYQRLLTRGFAANTITTLTALEHAFGTPDRIQAARTSANLTRDGRPSAPAITRRGTTQPSTRVDVLKKLPKDQLEAYNYGIQQGHYTDWKQVREEVEFGLKQTVNKALRQNTERLMRK